MMHQRRNKSIEKRERKKEKKKGDPRFLESFLGAAITRVSGEVGGRMVKG